MVILMNLNQFKMIPFEGYFMNYKNYILFFFSIFIFQVKSADILYHKVCINFKDATECENCHTKLLENSNIKILRYSVVGIFFLDLEFIHDSLSEDQIIKLLNDNKINWISFQDFDELGKYDFALIENTENKDSKDKKE